MKMQVKSDYTNSSVLEIAYQDAPAGKSRDCLITYKAPFYYEFAQKNASGVMAPFILAVIMPVSPGRCRLFLETPTMRKLSKKFPFNMAWFTHNFRNNFYDTDVWLHDQERFQRTGQNAFLPDSNNSNKIITEEKIEFADESNDINKNTIEEDQKFDINNGVSDFLKRSSNIGDKYVMTTQSDTGTHLAQLGDIILFFSSSFSFFSFFIFFVHSFLHLLLLCVFAFIAFLRFFTFFVASVACCLIFCSFTFISFNHTRIVGRDAIHIL